MAYIDKFFQVLLESGGSDLHLSQGQAPKIRRHGEILPIRDEALTNRLHLFATRLQEIENNLPMDPKYRNPKLGEFAPIRVALAKVRTGRRS